MGCSVDVHERVARDGRGPEPRIPLWPRQRRRRRVLWPATIARDWEPRSCAAIADAFGSVTAAVTRDQVASASAAYRFCCCPWGCHWSLRESVKRIGSGCRIPAHTKYRLNKIGKFRRSRVSRAQTNRPNHEESPHTRKSVNSALEGHVFGVFVGRTVGGECVRQPMPPPTLLDAARVVQVEAGEGQLLVGHRVEV